MNNIKDVAKVIHLSVIPIFSVIIILLIANLLALTNLNSNEFSETLKMAVSICGIIIGSISVKLAHEALNKWKSEMTNKDRYEFERNIRAKTVELHFLIESFSVVINNQIIQQYNNNKTDIRHKRKVLKGIIKSEDDLANKKSKILQASETLCLDTSFKQHARPELHRLHEIIKEDCYFFISNSTDLYESTFFGTNNNDIDNSFEKIGFRGSLTKKVLNNINTLSKNIAEEWDIN